MKSRYLVMLLLIMLPGLEARSETDAGAVLKPYVETLKEKGGDPVSFIVDKLDSYDLIIFDDALHTAVEPFEYYIKLLKEPRFQKKVKYIFLEVVSVTEQPAIDTYLASESGDKSELYPAFQNDFSGTGWPYKTYFDLLEAVRAVNRDLTEEDRLKVIAVNAPVFWKEINTARELELFRLSLAGNDYTMYKIILSYLDDFESGEKGIFLTNTRHAYKGIRNSQGELYWNCGTFFHQLDPGRTYSVRFHSINLSFKGRKEPDEKTARTTQGLENIVVEWVRMEKGLWDSAFRAFQYRPVAFDMKGTPFGKTPYIGNHMLDAASGQTMYDAYDALIFTAPVEEQRQTATVDFIYTEKFKDELERRYRILYTPKQLDRLLKDSGSGSLREYIERRHIYREEKVQPLAERVGPIDAWKENCRGR